MSVIVAKQYFSQIDRMKQFVLAAFISDILLELDCTTAVDNFNLPKEPRHLPGMKNN